jgi:hypothetical protein
LQPIRRVTEGSSLIIDFMCKSSLLSHHENQSLPEESNKKGRAISDPAHFLNILSRTGYLKTFIRTFHSR